MASCQGIRVNMTRCPNEAAKTVRVSIPGREDETYPACDSCASAVDGCDGVTLGSLDGFRYFHDDLIRWRVHPDETVEHLLDGEWVESLATLQGLVLSPGIVEEKTDVV